MISVIGAFALIASSAVVSAAPSLPTPIGPSLEVAHGDAPRAQRTVEFNPTWRVRNAGWQHFLTSQSGTWNTLWDRDTDVPLRIFGSGIDAPDAIASSERAEHHAWTHLAAHLPLLAPGSTVDDFAVISNQLVGDIRVVGFAQHHGGVLVLGGQIGFAFKRDRLLVIGSQALPHVRVATTKAAIADELAQTRARAWVSQDFGHDAKVAAIEESVIVPIVRPRGNRSSPDISYTTALVVTVRTEKRPGLWRVFVDAGTGEPVAREQLLRFGGGHLMFNAPVRWPGGARSDYPASYVNVVVDGLNVTADHDGYLMWDGSDDADTEVGAVGAYVRVTNSGGSNAEIDGQLMDGGSATWNEQNNEFADSQLTTYIHLNIAKIHARIMAPDLEWLDQTLQAYSNIDDVCNAYFDPEFDTVNFFREGGIGGFQCGNTGRLPDVVYHEFGHALHNAAVAGGLGYIDGAFSEGLSDYFAATITDDPAMGRGFNHSDAPLRHIDPLGQEASWPQDVDPDSVHTTGLIFAGAMWDLRAALIAELGPSLGDSYADQLFYTAVQLSADIPSTYVSVLLADDDDGDLGNGTPNQCLIEAAFAPHGLADPTTIGLGFERPTAHGFDISFRVLPPANLACEPIQVTDAVVEWRLRDNPAINGVAPMSQSGARFLASLPPQASGSVINYRVRIDMDSGATSYFPANAADPLYELFVGYAEEIYCTDFEVNPFFEGGWQSDAGAGLDDWHWGVPGGAAQDPVAAYSGTSVIGNNLDGSYEAQSQTYVDSPMIDVSGYDNVRLQYRRWLYVEDGYWDRASIYANGVPVWQNADSMNGDTSNTHHTDREWRFHDVDLTEQAQGGSIQLRFEMVSDAALQFGGWTIDDVCLVAHIPTTCGDGVVEVGEECDDGNAANGDSCTSACLLPIDDDRTVTAGCCDASGTPGTGAPLLWALVLFGLAIILRRRRPV